MSPGIGLQAIYDVTLANDILEGLGPVLLYPYLIHQSQSALTGWSQLNVVTGRPKVAEDEFHHAKPRKGDTNELCITGTERLAVRLNVSQLHIFINSVIGIS